MSSDEEQNEPHIDVKKLEKGLRDVIREYREEYNYLGGTGMTDRDEYNLTRRLAAFVGDKIGKMDTHYIEHLEDEVERLEQKAQFAGDPKFKELLAEYEGMRAIIKELIYRLGEEDRTVVIPNEQVQYKADNVNLEVVTEEMVTKLEVTEMES